MLEYPCPACGASVVFQSSISVFAVCPFCKSSLVRHDLNLETLGKMALPLNDTSPLQLGTEGTYTKLHFTLIGRVRKQWSDGHWDEWLALFDDARNGWLSEAQGFYSMCFEEALKDPPPSADSLHPDQILDLNGSSFQVTDIKPCTCHFGEGELPFVCEPGQAMTSVDLIADTETFGSLEYTADEARFFQGEYLKFADFGFKRLRVLEGW